MLVVMVTLVTLPTECDAVCILVDILRKGVVAIAARIGERRALCDGTAATTEGGGTATVAAPPAAVVGGIQERALHDLRIASGRRLFSITLSSSCGLKEMVPGFVGLRCIIAPRLHV